MNVVHSHGTDPAHVPWPIERLLAHLEVSHGWVPDRDAAFTAHRRLHEVFEAAKRE